MRTGGGQNMIGNRAEMHYCLGESVPKILVGGRRDSCDGLQACRGPDYLQAKGGRDDPPLEVVGQPQNYKSFFNSGERLKLAAKITIVKLLETQTNFIAKNVL